tara:strand:- start:19343 stop:19684 length:342 start_codon:yes stop_codon:yes gene_type:complete
MRYKIVKITFNVLLINLTIFCFGLIVKSETDFNFYITDFFNKNNRALEILKEIEINLKNGSKEKSCSKQRDAARIGILANDSLLKAYKINGTMPPMRVIESNKKKWLSLLENC